MYIYIYIYVDMWWQGPEGNLCQIELASTKLVDVNVKLSVMALP